MGHVKILTIINTTPIFIGLHKATHKTQTLQEGSASEDKGAVLKQMYFNE
jgi:hypothetical protein